MLITSKPHYILGSEYKWLRKYRHDKKALQSLKIRADMLYEYSIKDWNWNNNRICRLATTALEMYWAARYPECVETPNIQVYDPSIRGRLGLRLKNIGAITRLSSDKFDIATEGCKPHQILWFDKDVMDKAFR